MISTSALKKSDLSNHYRVARPNSSLDSLRICHLSKYYPPHPGGIETHVQTLATIQADLGAKVDVICINTTDTDGQPSRGTATVEELDKNVRVIRIGRLFSLARVDFSWEFSQYFSSREMNYDIAHLHTPNPAMALYWSLAQPSIPLVITHHSDIVKQRFLKHLVNPLMHYVYDQATQVLTTSPEYLRGSSFLQSHRDRVDVLPLGIDLSVYTDPSPMAQAETERLLEAHGHGPIWLAVGRMVYYKAMHIAIAALASVPGTLIIVGKGELQAELKQQAETLGVSDRIVWLPYASQAELIGAYHAATALWFPSNARSEAFGLVQVEAMASGCPVINAQVPHSGVSWVSRHEQEGFTIPLDNVSALAEAANRLLADPSLHERFRIASRQRARQFDHILMARKSFRVYERAIAASNSQSVLA
jgi:glycosyltransferase involved in cell wall biosynthesis